MNASERIVHLSVVNGGHHIELMQNVLIAGGTGLIGKLLTQRLLEKGYSVTILTRKIPTDSSGSSGGPGYALWSVKDQTIDADAIAHADHLIHLAGAGVADKRWTKKRKREIQDSRTNSSALLVKALIEIPNRIKTVLSASAIGWYVPTGQDSETTVVSRTETDPADRSFLGETCERWESSIDPVLKLNKRLVKFRTGIVLSAEGGALTEFKRPIRFGIAAILGNGRQVISWIHIEDLCRLYIEAIEKEQWQGVFNAVAPKPVDNKTLTLTLAKIMKGRFFIPFYIPSFLLKWLLGEMSVEVLKSVRVSADKIRKIGFQFLFPSVESALENIVKIKNQSAEQ